MHESRLACRVEGVELDDLTKNWLNLAESPEESCLIYDRMRSFFRDMRHRLNQLKMALYVARRSKEPLSEAGWNGLEHSYSGVEKLVERIERICRPPEVVPLPCDLDLIVSDRRRIWETLAAADRIEWVWEEPTGAVVGRFDPVRIAGALDGFVEWRAGELGEDSRVRVAWRQSDDALHFDWEELAQPSTAACEARGDEIPLALPLLVSVVSAHGGTVRLSQAEGLLLEVEWPKGRART